MAQGDEPAQLVELGVEVGVEGFADPDAPLPVTVSITAQELLVGRIAIGAGGLTTDVAVEVPALSSKEYVVTASAPGRTRSVSVTLYRAKADGSEERLLSRSARVQVPRNEVLVGVFGVDGIETTLRSAVVGPVERDVVPLPMTPAMFEWESGVLSYVVVGAGAFDALNEDQVSSVDRWVRAGGRLYGPGSTVAAITDAASGVAWPGTSAVVTRLGMGEVGAVEPTTLSAEEWGSLLRATPPLGLIRNEAFVTQPFGLVSAASAGREAAVPALPWLLAGIALFVVLVGPLNFVVLRRFGRPELAWLTVPVLSAVFVATFWVVGKSQLEDFTISAASVVIDADARSDGYGGFVLQVETGGTHDVVFGDGWSAEPAAFGGASAGTAFTDAAGNAGLSFDLEDLGVGTGETDWRAEPLDAVTVSLTPTSNETEATVVNASSLDFWGWGLVVNGVGYVGDEPLPAGSPGQSIDVRLRSSRTVYEPIISEAINRRGFRLDGFDSLQYGVVNGLAGVAEAELPGLRQAGVYFFGFVEAAELPVAVDGRTTTAAGPGLYVKEITLDGGAALALGEVRPELLEVTGASTVEAFYEEIYAYGADELYFSYLIPAGAPTIGEIDGSRVLDVAEAYRWETGEFEPIEWNVPFDTSPYVSVGGDFVVRARPPDDGFFDREIRLSQFALEWSTT